MSLGILSAASSVLPSLDVHPHGHMKGVHGQSADIFNIGSSEAPASAPHNLFGRLLHSVEQVIGVRLGSAANTASAAAGAAAGAATARGAKGAGLNVNA